MRGIAEQKNPAVTEASRLPAMDAEHRRPAQIGEPETAGAAFVD